MGSHIPLALRALASAPGAGYYSMQAVIPGITMAINIPLALWALVRNPRDPHYRTFSLFALSIAIWSMGGVLNYLGEAEYPTWLDVSFVGTMLAPANFVCLAVTAALYRRLQGWRQFSLYLLYVPALVMSAFCDLRFAAPGALSHSWRKAFYDCGDPRAIMVASYYGVFLLGAAAVSVVSYRRTSGRGRLNHKALLHGVELPLGLGILGVLLVAWLRPNPSPAVSLWVMCVSQYAMFVMVRRRMVRIELTLSRTVAYLFGAVMLAAATLILVSVLARLFKADVTPEAVLILTFSAICLSFVFAALRDRIQEFTDRTFFRESYEYQKMIEQFEAELGRTQERLRHAERLAAVGELAASVAHEIKNPLGPIKGYVELLEKELARSSDQAKSDMSAKALRIIREEVENIDAKVRRLLDMAQESAGHREPCDVNEIVERSLFLLAYERSFHSNVHLHKRLDPGLPMLVMSQGRVQGAIFNVLLNAVQALDTSGGRLSVVTREEEEDGRPWVVVQIGDTGRGMTEEQKQHIFDPFRTFKADGTGLGMSIAKKVIEDHDGTIEVQSAPRRGTTVTMRFLVPADRRNTGD